MNVSPYQFSKNVEKVIEEYVRPLLAQDGGDVEIVPNPGAAFQSRSNVVQFFEAELGME